MKDVKVETPPPGPRPALLGQFGFILAVDQLIGRFMSVQPGGSQNISGFTFCEGNQRLGFPLVTSNSSNILE